MPTQVDSGLGTKRVEFVRQVAPFAGLREPNLSALAHDFKARIFKPGETIFQPGVAGERLSAVATGKNRIFCRAPSGNETTIDVFSAGRILGEFAPLDDLERTTSPIALEPYTLLSISKQQFLDHVRAMPDLALGVIRLLIAKARWTTDIAESLAQYDAADWLLHVLLHYVRQNFARWLVSGSPRSRCD